MILAFIGLQQRVVSLIKNCHTKGSLAWRSVRENQTLVVDIAMLYH